ncbi:uncharacterized protein KRP23_9820 [Phytophthora ramorum]|uniref:uncharacterized protein n=1 Tax=Phytophthora ramorum TaxID=164328 RepID=UPI00309EA019|nr:hypothetical protein KRP23_9820 [Phytophthora ramorum]
MTNYYKAHEKQVTAFPRYNELAAELRTSKQQATALSQHNEQVRVELEEAKTKAMQHEEESSTLRTEIKALQNKVKTAGQEKQDLETQLVVSQRGLCSSASDEDTDDYVVPPVDLPGSYRAQGLQGGELVGGRYVLFTNWGFKRQQQRMPHLRPIPERTDAGDRELPSSDEIKEATPVKLLEVVSKPAELSAQTQERRVQKRASDVINDSDDMDHFLRQVRRRLAFCMAGDHESPASDGTNEATPATLMEVVGKTTEMPAQTQERCVQKRTSDKINDSDDMDTFLRLIRRRLDSCLADAAAWW